MSSSLGGSRMKEILSIIVPTVFGIIGVAIMIVPPKSLLSWDRRAGYRIYKRTLDKTRDEDKAVRAAGLFYKFFGVLFVVFSVLFLTN